jgi:hypothetical protein
VALVEPAATVTLAGTPATPVLLLERDTSAPPAGAAAVRAAVAVDEFPPVTVAGLTVIVFRVAGPVTVKCGRTATQSRKKSRDVELATLITRNLKFAFARSAALHARPHVSAVPPSVNVASVVPRVAVVLAAVHVVPPSGDTCTHILGVPDVLSARASSRTSMPATEDPLGTEIPKSRNWCRSFPVLVHDVLVPVPLFVSVATALSSPNALTGADWKPSASPPVSAECAVGLRKPGAPPPPAPPPPGGFIVKVAL